MESICRMAHATVIPLNQRVSDRHRDPVTWKMAGLALIVFTSGVVARIGHGRAIAMAAEAVLLAVHIMWNGQQRAGFPFRFRHSLWRQQMAYPAQIARTVGMISRRGHDVAIRSMAHQAIVATFHFVRDERWSQAVRLVASHTRLAGPAGMVRRKGCQAILSMAGNASLSAHDLMRDADQAPCRF